MRTILERIKGIIIGVLGLIVTAFLPVPDWAKFGIGVFFIIAIIGAYLESKKKKELPKQI